MGSLAQSVALLWWERTYQKGTKILSDRVRLWKAVERGRIVGNASIFPILRSNFLRLWLLSMPYARIAGPCVGQRYNFSYRAL
jgi:hypothetical protein